MLLFGLQQKFYKLELILERKSNIILVNVLASIL